ncbi:MAG TPA: hypothetical protein DCL41_09455 [Bdellovibrionales bacterium]|nr:hypothetical protein [Pseudobdellovibrionaceae bacterium]HAG92087.1 hypothetical protein [Bdellovibrionales bacterium]|tara:strand:+ start:8873 stop:9055 length:183 start_codon:yes stop_codon:yes gene_type:complete
MSLKSQKGQVVIEYVLLLMIGVGIAALFTSLMVSRSPETPGFLIVKWTQIIQTIGQDYPD